MLEGLRYEATPSAIDLVKLVDDGDLAAVCDLIEESWPELWFAFQPADMRRILEMVPDTVAVGSGVRHLAQLTGAELAPTATKTSTAAVLDAGQEGVRLRLAGRPVAGLERFRASQEQATDGALWDSSEGFAAVGLVQGGILHILAGDLTSAKGVLLEASGMPSPVRFPFVEREALAKLALAMALSGDAVRARYSLDQARAVDRTASWVENLIDDTVWLTEYIVTIDSLDIATAERMRLERPSPLAHLEFWGIALQAQVRHLVLTDRHEHARDLCEEVAAVGLPLEGSDGWLASMLAEARAMCIRPGWELPKDLQDAPASSVLARRQQWLIMGHFDLLAARVEPDLPDYGGDGRVRLALLLLRAQGVLGMGREEEGRHLLIDALRETFAKGTHGVLRFVTDDALRSLGNHELASKASRIAAEARLPRPEVRRFISSPLTPAQLRVLRLVRDGYSRQQIADALDLSLQTVKSHLSSAYRKLGVKNRSAAIARLTELGF